MGNRETRITHDKTVESQSEKKSSSKSQESSSTLYDRAKNGVGIAYAGALKAAEATIKSATVAMAVQAFSGLGGAHAISTSDAPSTALVSPDSGSRDGDNATALHFDQKGLSHLSNQTNLERSFRNVTPEAFSHPKGPTVEQLWPKLYEEMVKSSGEQGDASKNSLQGEAQGRHDGETSSEQQNQKENAGKKNLSLNERHIATLKAVVEKASKDPEFAARVSRKLAESRAPSEQDKGTEHLTPEKVDPEVLENTKRKLYEECLQWLSVKGVLGSTTIVDGPLSGEGTTVELSLQADNNCGGNVDHVRFNAGITYTCPSECKPGNGGSVGEVGGQAVVENGTPSTIEDGQLSQAQIITYAFCQQVDSNGDVTAILPPSSVSALVTTLGTYNGEVVQSPVQPVNFVS